MSFFTILLALLLEQAKPLSPGNPIHQAVRKGCTWVAHNLDAGQQHLAWVSWGMVVLVPALLCTLVHAWLAWGVGWLAAMLWSVALLYVTLGFRQFSHHFTAIREALDAGDEVQARALLAQWQGTEVGQIGRREILRQVIAHSVLAAHRHVFGVFFWYAAMSVVGLGPAGAIVYRLAEYVQRRWQREPGTHEAVSAWLTVTAQRAWATIDWLPARATALGFAMVGSFEDAMDGWRQHAQKFPADNDGVILAATAGAIHVRLSGAANPTQHAAHMSEGSAAAQEPQLGHLASVVGLVWRSAVMWLLLLALLTMANLLG